MSGGLWVGSCSLELTRAFSIRRYDVGSSRQVRGIMHSGVCTHACQLVVCLVALLVFWNPSRTSTGSSECSHVSRS